MGDFNLETLVLQRLGKRPPAIPARRPGRQRDLQASKTTPTGSIGRVILRYAASPDLAFEAGGEGAYNYLNGRSSFLSNGAAVALP